MRRLPHSSRVRIHSGPITQTTAAAELTASRNTAGHSPPAGMSDVSRKTLSSPNRARSAYASGPTSPAASSRRYEMKISRLTPRCRVATI